MRNIDHVRNKSISELEGYKWTEDIPNENSSFLEQRFYELHNRKIKELDVEDIDLYIEQEYGPKYTIPLALEVLRKDFFVETDYEGALLFNLLSIGQEYWEEFPEYQQELLAICQDNIARVNSLDTTEDIRNDILEVWEVFLGRVSG